MERCGKPVIRGVERLSLERQVRIASGGLAAVGGLLALTVNPLFAILPAFVGSGLVFAGVTNTCAMAMFLVRLSYNRPATCDVGAMVRGLLEGSEPEYRWTRVEPPRSIRAKLCCNLTRRWNSSDSHSPHSLDSRSACLAVEARFSPSRTSCTCSGLPPNPRSQ